MSCLASFCTNHRCGQGLHMCASAQMLMGPSVVTFTNSQRRSKDMVRAPLMSSWISTCTRNSNHQKYRSICERCITSCPRGNDPENRQPSKPWLMVVHLPNECVQSPAELGLWSRKVQVQPALHLHFCRFNQHLQADSWHPCAKLFRRQLRRQVHRQVRRQLHHPGS